MPARFGPIFSIFNRSRAIDGLRKDSGRRGFSNASGTCEKVGVSETVQPDGILECLRNVFLRNDLLEKERSVLAGRDQIGRLRHGRTGNAREFRARGRST